MFVYVLLLIALFPQSGISHPYIRLSPRDVSYDRHEELSQEKVNCYSRSRIRQAQYEPTMRDMPPYRDDELSQDDDRRYMKLDLPDTYKNSYWREMSYPPYADPPQINDWHYINPGYKSSPKQMPLYRYKEDGEGDYNRYLRPILPPYPYYESSSRETTLCQRRQLAPQRGGRYLTPNYANSYDDSYSAEMPQRRVFTADQGDPYSGHYLPPMYYESVKDMPLYLQKGHSKEGDDNCMRSNLPDLHNKLYNRDEPPPRRQKLLSQYNRDYMKSMFSDTQNEILLEDNQLKENKKLSRSKCNQNMNGVDPMTSESMSNENSIEPIFVRKNFTQVHLNMTGSKQMTNSCRTDPGNMPGECTLFKNCLTAFSLLINKREMPTLCPPAYVGDRSNLICCPYATTNNMSINTTTTTISPLETPTITNTTDPHNPGWARAIPKEKIRISEIECLKMYSGRRRDISRKRENIDKSYQFSYMCILGWMRTTQADEIVYNCGCVLISPRHVLTSAHCTTLYGSAPSIARIGSKYLNDSSGELTEIDQIILHPQYESDSIYNDIAIIKLAKDSNYVPSCLWHKGAPVSTTLTALGYGETVFGGPNSDKLAEIYLKTVPLQQCKNFYSSEERFRDGLNNGQLCAADPGFIADSCQGESGGPLLVNEIKYGMSIPYVLGLTSFGLGCSNGIPTLYTNVSHYLNWIEPNVW